MSDLMELVNECEESKGEQFDHLGRNLLKADELATLGFTHMAAQLRAKSFDKERLGRINGKPERYFIAQWGDDVQLDDIL